MHLHALAVVVQVACLGMAGVLFAGQPDQDSLPRPDTRSGRGDSSEKSDQAGTFGGGATSRMVWVTAGLAALTLGAVAGALVQRRRIQQQSAVLELERDAHLAREREFKAWIEQSNDLFYSHDLEGNILSFNKAAATLFGFPNENTAGANLFQLVTPDQREVLRGELKALQNAETPTTFEFEIEPEPGRRICLEAVLRTSSRDSGAVEVFAVARDVSEQRQSEAQWHALENNYQECQKLINLGLKAGSVAHTFNNLLTAILGNASLVRMELPRESLGQAHVSEIEKTSLEAAELCRQMMASAGWNEFDPRVADLSAMIEEMKPLIEVSVPKTISVRFDVCKESCPIRVDFSQIRQGVVNLAINVCEAIGDGPASICISTGTVRFADGESPEDAVYPLGVPEPGSYCYVEVADARNLAEPVGVRVPETHEQDATAAELSVPALVAVARAHRGLLKTSHPKQPRKIALLIPAHSHTAVEVVESKRDLEQVERPTGKTILVVDDEAPIRRLLQRVLVADGYDVIQAPDGADGVVALEAHANEIVLVLLDMTMPRLSGEEAFFQMKTIRPNVRIVVMSGYTEQAAADRLMKEDAAGFLRKPFKPDDLRKTLQTIFESNGSKN